LITCHGKTEFWFNYASARYYSAQTRSRSIRASRAGGIANFSRRDIDISDSGARISKRAPRTIPEHEIASARRPPNFDPTGSSGRFSERFFRTPRAPRRIVMRHMWYFNVNVAVSLYIADEHVILFEETKETINDHHCSARHRPRATGGCAARGDCNGGGKVYVPHFFVYVERAKKCRGGTRGQRSFPLFAAFCSITTCRGYFSLPTRLNRYTRACTTPADRR